LFINDNSGLPLYSTIFFLNFWISTYGVSGRGAMIHCTASAMLRSSALIWQQPVGSALDLEDYHPSVLLNCWLGHLTCKIVSKMTYNVSSGTLNRTIQYQYDNSMFDLTWQKHSGIDHPAGTTVRRRWIWEVDCHPWHRQEGVAIVLAFHCYRMIVTLQLVDVSKFYSFKRHFVSFWHFVSFNTFYTVGWMMRRRSAC